MIYASAGIPCQLDPAEPKAKADTGEEFLITADPALPCCFQMSNQESSFLLSMWWQRWEWVCEQDSVASRLNQVQEGKGDGVQQRRSRKGSSIPFISS